MEAFFLCHPPDSKCEWVSAVRDFAVQFNRLRNTDYVRATCFDATSYDHPVPEVRLVATGLAPMVVERKTIERPQQFLHGHSHWHRLADYLSRNLACLFQEPRCIAIDSNQLQGLCKKDIDRLAELILQQIRAGRESGLVPSRPAEAMPWRIQAGLISAPAGTRIEVLDWPGQSWPAPHEFVRLRQEQICGFRSQLKKRLGDVERKFRNFPGHYRVLLVQFVGESSALIEETDLPPIVTVAQDAGFVDELWIATKEWISMDDYEILWVPAPSGT